MGMRYVLNSLLIYMVLVLTFSRRNISQSTEPLIVCTADVFEDFDHTDR